MNPQDIENFEQAEKRFKNFLNENRWPSRIIWVSPSSIIMKSPQKAELRSKEKYDQNNAKKDYSEAVNRGLGVAIEGVATTSKITYAAITWPKNEIESEYLLYSDSGF